MNKKNKYTTEDKTLTINLFYNNETVQFNTPANRILFGATRDQITIVDDKEYELIYIEIRNAATTNIDLLSSNEAHDIADFLGIKIYKFAENGNDYIVSN